MEDRTFALLEKMYSEFIDFKEDMLGFKGEMKAFKEDMLGFKEETKVNFEKLESRFNSKIETEVSHKLEALFDGYKANSEKLDEVHDKVDNLQLEVNNLSIKVANNDNKIIEIRRDLRSAK
jgi:predicted  nucleic acid-binding Zn-ribbon protein